MLIQFTDFNGAADLIAGRYSAQWADVVAVLAALPLHLKASDQRGLEGSAIFDVVGTNEFIKVELLERGWLAGIPIPKEFAPFGQSVDFGKDAVVLEVQFSNYPFLLNNAVRGDLFFKEKTLFSGKPIDMLIIVTKAWMFPASNSTLYYEQGVNQLKWLCRYKKFDVPIRLVGLFERQGASVPVKWTDYHSKRYSRTPTERSHRLCDISPGVSGRSRCIVRLHELLPGERK